MKHKTPEPELLAGFSMYNHIYNYTLSLPFQTMHYNPNHNLTLTLFLTISVYWFSDMTFEPYLRSWDAFRWATLEQNFLFQ